MSKTIGVGNGRAGRRRVAGVLGCLSAVAVLAATPPAAAAADDVHAQALGDDAFPSATACAPCHETQYRQWSMSQHAYSQMSPVFNAMQTKIFQLTNGTNGDFCIRCHTPVGMNRGEREVMSNIDRHPTSREGVTCTVCHRINKNYGKVSGRLSLVPGPLTSPIYGPRGDPAELNRVIEQGGLATDPGSAGRQVHATVEPFFLLNKNGFCGTCHDVTLLNGFRLEEAFSEYKNSPAADQKITCQDCHMGLEPGRVLADKQDPEVERKNYAFGPAAKVGGITTEPRKLTNHMFVGPDHSVLPPALFPLNTRAIKEESQKNDPTAAGLATIREWLEFDWKAGWGTDDFEDEVADDFAFPARWESYDDRVDARDIIDENLALLAEARKQQLVLLQNGYKLGEIEVLRAGEGGIRFRIQVSNGTNGHSVPTGFDAERLVWLHVQVHDATGALIKESGALDPNGDVLDLHSAYVHNHELPLDHELFSLQSKFVTRNVRGGEREQVLSINYSPSPLPFIRPAPLSTVLLGRPTGARKHKLGIPPGGARWAEYKVTRGQLTGKGPYTVTVTLNAGMVPINLLNEIRSVGFDYNLSARDISEAVVAGHQAVWTRAARIDLHAGEGQARRGGGATAQGAGDAQD